MDPFDVLGVDPGADEDAVERAYRERVKEAHPDQGGSAAEFRRVRDAYEAIVSGMAATDRDGTAGAGGDSGPPAGAGPDPGPDPRPSPGDEPAGADGAAAGEAATPEEPAAVEVEYLNYEALGDHGWDVDDPDLFEKAAGADLDPVDHGRVTVESGESLLEAAEKAGFSWPFACRGGACANCAVAVRGGDLDQPADHILPDEMVDRGFRLSCVGAPITADTRVVYNVKHLPGLDELRLPPHPFDRSRAGD